jgi:hypothetical protein
LDRDGPAKPPRASRSNRAFMALLLLLSIPACSPARVLRRPASDPAASPVELRLRTPLATSYSSASPLQFRFTAPQNSVFRLDIAQRDMRLRFTVLRPDGSTLLEQSTPVTADTSIVAAVSLPGSYAVIVTPQQPDGRARQLTIALADIGPPNPRRALELAAATALKAGDALAEQWTEEALDKAIVEYGEAASGWRRAGDLPQASNALLRKGDIHCIRGEYRETLAAPAPWPPWHTWSSSAATSRRPMPISNRRCRYGLTRLIAPAKPWCSQPPPI